METKLIVLTAGTGPLECMWVVAKVLPIFLDEAQHAKIKTSILHIKKGSENRTIQSAYIELKGNKLDTFLSKWLGTLQWIGTSEFRKMHKRKNWFVGVFEFKQMQPVSFNENEVNYQVFRSSGAGGQHVNKVSTAVRAWHDPTGIFAVAQEHKSQLMNKKAALERLQEKVMQKHYEQMEIELKNSQFLVHYQLERGNPVRVFTGSDFKIKKEKDRFKNQRQKDKNDLKNQLKNEL